MIRQAPWLRYVVVQIKGVSGAAGVWWHARAATADEGFQLLEARIAEEYLGRGARPPIALVDCAEGRVLGSSHPVGDGASLVSWARDHAVRERVETSGEPAGPDIAPPASRDVPDDDGGNGGSTRDDEDGEDGEDGDEEPEARDESLQALVDRYVAEFLEDRLSPGTSEAMEAALEARDDIYESDDDGITAVSHEMVRDWLAGTDEDEARGAIDVDDDVPLGLEEWTRFVVDDLIPRLLEDADVSYGFGSKRLTDSEGRTVTLVCHVRGYSFSGVAIGWIGPRRSWAEFEAELAEGWFTSPEQFAALDAKTRRTFLRKPGRRKTR